MLCRVLYLTVTLLSMLSTVSRAFVSSSFSIAAFSKTRIPFPAAATATAVTATTSRPQQQRPFHMSTAVNERKAGVASPEELKEFVAKAGDRLVVVDVRNPDASVEPGDEKSLKVAPVPNLPQVRPKGLHLIYDRNAKSMPLPDVEKDTPIITHCGGGGRGQKAKDYLMEHGFTNVLNGGGPKETECWAEFGEK